MGYVHASSLALAVWYFAILTIEALLCLRESCGMNGGLLGEVGGEMERSWTLVGLEKEDERPGRWWFSLTWCADEARPSCPNSGRVNLLALLSIS